jgi:hypothetical protein
VRNRNASTAVASADVLAGGEVGDPPRPVPQRREHAEGGPVDGGRPHERVLLKSERKVSLTGVAKVAPRFLDQSTSAYLPCRRLVIGERRGRSIVYALHDSHVADLLDQAVYHIEHLRLDFPEAD